MFFKKFPKISYSFIGSKEKKIVTNILTAFIMKKIKSFRTMLFQTYTLKDEDTPESLSQTLYDSPYHYWTLLISNNVINPFYEWSLSKNIIEKLTEKKYKNGIIYKKTDGTNYTLPLSIGINGLHHFFNINTGRQCDDVEDEYYREKYSRNPRSIGNNIIPVTNLEYENEVNLKNREILIVAKHNLVRFEEDFNNMLIGDNNQ
jgi:hypothetical protein